MSSMKRSVQLLAAMAAIAGAATAFGATTVYLENFETLPPAFTTDHDYYPAPTPGNTQALSPLFNTQTFTVDTNPYDWHMYWTPFGDHTSGSGNMMIINAASNLARDNSGTDPLNCSVNVFKSPLISSLPPGEYKVSYQIALSYANNPPLLKMSVNGGVDIIDTFDASGGNAIVGDWTLVEKSFTLPAGGSAQIALCDDRTMYDGDDYALDDIALELVNEFQWCSPGYWRNHLLSWSTSLQNTKYSPLLGSAPPVKLKAIGCTEMTPTDPTLLDVLQFPQCYGGNAYNLVADYLSQEVLGTPLPDPRVDNCPLN